MKFAVHLAPLCGRHDEEGLRHMKLFVIVLCALAGALPAAALAAKPVPTPVYDCAKIMPAATWDALMGTTDALTSHMLTAGGGSFCTYGNAKVAIVTGKGAATNWKGWLAATTRNASVTTQLPGIGVQASLMMHSVAVLTKAGNYVQVLAPSATDDAGIEAVAKAVAAHVK